MSEFDSIRPYNDNEVDDALERLLSDQEMLNTMIRFRFPKAGSVILACLRPIVRNKLKTQLKGIHTVNDFQLLVQSYLGNTISKTTDKLTVSGLDNLSNSSPHLFISNHRDIAMDPAFVNWVLNENGFSTLRIAIGDNLLTKPFASELMRLNKSFIVNRSLKAPREKFKAAKLLSKYIHHSVVTDNENVWIAQREGRAKDGLDITNSAIIGMLALSKPKPQSLGDYIREANIVPVSISYEYDPCDYDKARELTEKKETGGYEKAEHEDVRSIAKGITGHKGHVHLAFGQALSKDYANVDEIVDELNQKIVENYRIQLSNCFAYESLFGKSPKVHVGEDQSLFTEKDVSVQREKFKARLETIDDQYKKTFLYSYANPVRAKLNEVN